MTGRTEYGLKKAAEEMEAKTDFVLDRSKHVGISSSMEDYDLDLSKAHQKIDTEIHGLLPLSVSSVTHFNGLLNDGVNINVLTVLGYRYFTKHSFNFTSQR